MKRFFYSILTIFMIVSQSGVVPAFAETMSSVESTQATNTSTTTSHLLSKDSSSTLPTTASESKEKTGASTSSLGTSETTSTSKSAVVKDTTESTKGISNKETRSGSLNISLLYSDETSNDAHPDGESSYTEDNMTGYLKIDPNELTEDLNNLDITLSMPSEYVELFKVPEFTSLGAHTISQATQVGDQLQVTIHFDSYRKVESFKLPLIFKFKSEIVPEDYQLAVQATATSATIQTESNQTIYTPKYDDWVIDKYVNSNKVGSDKIDGAEAIGGTVNNGIITDPADVIFAFRLNDIQSTDSVLHHRQLDEVTLTDKLPTYIDSSGATKIASFDPAKNPKWTLSADGTSVSRTYSLKDGSTPVGVQVYQDSNLIVTFPNAKLTVTGEVASVNLSNHVNMDGIKKNQSAGETDELSSDDLKFKLTNQKENGDKGYFSKTALNDIYDSMPAKTAEYPWVINFSNSKSTTPFKNVKLSDRQLDNRLKFVSIKSDNFSVANTTIKDSVKAVYAYKEDGTYDEYTPEFDTQGKLDVTFDSQTVYVGVDVIFNDTFEVALGDAFSFWVYSSYKDPENTHFDTEDAAKNVYTNSADLFYDVDSQNVKLTSADSYKMLPLTEGLNITKQTYYNENNNTVGARYAYMFTVSGSLLEEKDYQNLQIVDLLPTGVDLDGNPDSPYVDTSNIKTVPNYHNSGHTAVIFPLLQDKVREVINTGTSLTITFFVKINDHATPGKITNNAYIGAENLPSSTSKDAVIDKWDLNNDGSTDDMISHGNSDASVIAPENIYSEKFIKQKDSDSLIDGTIAFYPNDEFDYVLQVINGTKVAQKGLVIYDTLTRTNDSNKSEYNVQLTEAITPPEGYQVFYTTDESVYEKTMNEVVPEDIWQTSVSDFSKVTAYKVVANPDVELAGSETLSVTIPVKNVGKLDVDSQTILDGKEFDDNEGGGISAYLKANNIFYYTTDSYNSPKQSNMVTSEIPYAGFVLKKVDEKTQAALVNAEFQLTSTTDTSFSEKKTTDEDGLLRFNDLTQGTYTLRETKAPIDYELNNTPITVKVTEDLVDGKISVTFSSGTGTGTSTDPLIVSNKLTPGNVILTKTDEKTGEVLKDAVFELQDKDGNPLRSGLMTDETGEISVNDLAPGDYQFIETKAPTGYDLDNTPVTFTIEKGQTEAVKVSMTNKLTPGGVVLTKTDEETGEVLQGAVFELQDKDGKVLQSGLTTDASGKIAVNDLAPGDYQLVETQAPTGYNLNATPVTFTIEKGQTEVVQVGLTNVLSPGVVILTKVDDKSGETLQGAVFELQDKDGKVLQNGLTTGKDGKLMVNPLEPGDYQFVETQAPAGYDLNTTPITFTVEKDQTTAVQVKATNTLTPGGVVLTKVDDKSGEVLQGAVFELQDKDGKALQSGLTTDETGKISVNDLAPGDYQFVETQAPTGYELDKTPVKFTIEKGQTEVVQVQKADTLTPGGVVLTKVDGKTGEVLQGAVFELQDEKGKPLQSGLTTDASGKIEVNDLEPGNYQFVETQAPTGYNLNATPVKFTVEKGQKEVVQVQLANNMSPNAVILTKTVVATGEVLQGAVFELQDKDGHMLQNGLTTGKDGKLMVNPLQPGDYQFVETQAPTGYELNKTPIKFTIKKGQTVATQVSMTNKLIVGGVVLTKIDSDTGEKLPGAVFELQDEKGQTMTKNLVTDETGKLAIDNLKPGNYQLVETQAPVGYVLDKTPVKFTIKTNQTSSVSVTKGNKQENGSVIFDKIDEKTGAKLAGAEFKLVDSKGKTIIKKLVTNSEGRLAITKLHSGKYQLIETKAPKGYILDATPITFELKNDQTTEQKLKKVNKEKDNTLRVEKRDATTNEVLQGAKFNLLDANGKVIKENLVTDENGSFEVSNIKAGNYQLVETQAPKGYIKDSQPLSVTVKSGSGLTTVTKLNVRDADVQTTKNTPKHEYFPNTGVKNSLYLMIIGILIASLSGLWFVLKHAKENEKYDI
ncbi:SpaA isopeptide-forming pilin-related protein [Enterococcus faecalis]